MLRSIPEREGVPSGAIDKYLRALVGQKLAMHSVMFVRHGKIISESYYKPFGPEFRHRLYSCSKSFTSVAIGLLVERGLLSLDDKCVKFFPDKVGPDTDPYLMETTVRDLLLMAAPYTGGSSYSPQDPCWEDTFFNDEVSHVPGTVFSYCTTATTMLCAIFRRVTGKNFLEI
jgi:CubicO group peptidase (beta-lactamase class C family)